MEIFQTLQTSVITTELYLSFKKVNFHLEKRLNDKMRKAELIAREKRAEREARIKENAKEEERKLEKQRARLEQNKRQSEMREKELAINLDKKLSEAEKTRKIKKLRECESRSFS